MEMLDALQESTRDLISEEGQMITLWRAPGPVPDGEGGFTPGGQPVPLTSAKRFFGATPDNGEMVVTSEGQQFKATYVLVGTENDDIRDGDHFFVNGRKYIVRFVSDEKDYEKLAYVVRYASP